MILIRTFTLAFLLLAGVVITFAQSEPAGKTNAPSGTTITMSISAKGVRFTALGNIGQMRLEVFNAGGESLYNSDFKAGNVQDWTTEDQRGQPLADGSYLCVITTRDFAGRLGIKQGTVLVQAGQVSLKLGESEQAGTVEAEKALAPVTQDDATALALLAHDGQQGKVVSSNGDLSFRFGNFFAGKDVERMRLTTKGELGLGVEHPQAKLDVDGPIRTSEGIVFPDGTVQTTAYVASGRSLSERARVQRDAAGRALTSQAGQAEPELPSVLNGSFNKLAKFAADGTSLVDSALYEATGTVGIGTASPAALLHTKSASAHDLYLENTKDLSIFFRAGVPNTVQLTAGTVGGQSALDISLATGKGLRMTTTPFPVYGVNDVYFQLNTNSQDLNAFAVIESTNLKGLALSVAEARPVIFGTSRTERMRITGTGNVGIGTNNPQSKLEVAGDLQVMGNAVISGNIAAKYQDVAEWVPTSQALAAGTVVSLDVQRSNAVVAARRAYDAHIAGVVTAQPGVILGEGGAGKVLVATTGRVKVKVDASRHPIKIGDLLVSSGKSGLAKKSQPLKVGGALLHRPGTIIGKALEPLAKGQGEILVLLSLQ